MLMAALLSLPEQKSQNVLLDDLGLAAQNLLKWSEGNRMKANPSPCK